MSYVYKNWRGKTERIYGELHRVYRKDGYAVPIIKAKGAFWYYYDSPGGQRSRIAFNLLRDTIDDLEATHANRD